MGNARDHPPINEKVFISILHLVVKDKKKPFSFFKNK